MLGAKIRRMLYLWVAVTVGKLDDQLCNHESHQQSCSVCRVLFFDRIQVSNNPRRVDICATWLNILREILLNREADVRKYSWTDKSYSSASKKQEIALIKHKEPTCYRTSTVVTTLQHHSSLILPSVHKQKEIQRVEWTAFSMWTFWRQWLWM